MKENSHSSPPGLRTSFTLRGVEARAYRQCSVSVLDTIDDPGMRFDDEGRCHYYHDYQKAHQMSVRSGAEGALLLDELVAKIQANGTGKPYDSIIGLSGGVDSTYMAYQAAKLGLRPLAVHFDNGWNSELAVGNVENTVNRLGLDLHTLVVNWDEFKDLQLAYLRAGVVDVEVATDHAIAGTLYRLARKNGLKYLLSGSNVVTEGILPEHWIFNKLDHVNLLDIHRQFGTRRLKTYPICGTVTKKLCIEILGIQWLSLLNLMPYRYLEARETISQELGWIDYGGKHHESVFTRFYQCYVLPKKFGIDKRKAHLSNLIFSGQMSRAEALSILERPPCSDDVLASDKEFVLKKLGLDELEFDRIMSEAPRAHTEFKTERPMSKRYPASQALRPLWKMARAAASRVNGS